MEAVDLSNEAREEPDMVAWWRGEIVCEFHPDKPHPHDDCDGAGMPPRKTARD